ncbi:hypothetical protein AVEN_199149-1 [Araneus ventricosus]|uniref:Uncharacterized protein n=1 Tax=Araneus ventricosus TaxID=182803 RepID=A0A4Y2JYR7_ARAVE|nr:hypothetical protein AVEN_199149-1 [Araneus ventricosus]
MRVGRERPRFCKLSRKDFLKPMIHDHSTQNHCHVQTRHENGVSGGDILPRPDSLPAPFEGSPVNSGMRDSILNWSNILLKTGDLRSPTPKSLSSM